MWRWYTAWAVLVPMAFCVCVWGGGGGVRAGGHRWTGQVSLGRRKPRITSDIGTWGGGGLLSRVMFRTPLKYSTHLCGLEKKEKNGGFPSKYGEFLCSLASVHCE